MSEKTKHKRFGWPFWLISAGLIAFFVDLTKPEIFRSKKDPTLAEAISNLSQIYYPLIEFAEQYGALPNDETTAMVQAKHPSDIVLSSTSSNALLRQMFAAKIADSEKIFYAKVPGARRPDGDMQTGHLLEKGEVAFAYVAGLSLESNSSCPILLAPIIPGTKKFDPKPFNGRALVLRLDKSISVLRIDKDGHAIMGGGKTVFETGGDTVWGQIAPDIRYPEL